MQVQGCDLHAVSKAHAVHRLRVAQPHSQHAALHTFNFATYLARAGNSLNLAPRRAANIKFGPMAISAKNPMLLRPRSFVIIRCRCKPRSLRSCDEVHASRMQHKAQAMLLCNGRIYRGQLQTHLPQLTKRQLGILHLTHCIWCRDGAPSDDTLSLCMG